jgi:hypothetical protein
MIHTFDHSITLCSFPSKQTTNEPDTFHKSNTDITSIPACRKNRCAEKNDRYFDLKHLKSLHTLISPIIFYKLYSVATPGHPEPLLLESHVHIVALTPNLQRVSFYSVTEFLHHSSTTKLILSLVLYKGVLSKLQALPLYRKS